jgi:tRNA nucleotidyltransferase (CCA-adding enzyme)
MTIDWAAKLAGTMWPPLYEALQTAIEAAAAQGVPLYLVGGPVRDAYLRQPISDLDLVTDGDAWPVAERFAAATGGRLTKHERFRTAVVEVASDDGVLPIDFVTARRETYAVPAALPDVTPSTIDDDLARRDFTINTLALRFERDGSTTLLDPFGGKADIDRKRVRVLHDRSFTDDPTRILRAARFAARLGFEVEPETAALIEAAVRHAMIERTTPQRILHELWLLLDEPQPADALALLYGWGALPQLKLRWNPAWRDQFGALSQTVADADRRSVGWGVLVWPLDAAGRHDVLQRYNLPHIERKLVEQLPLAFPDPLIKSHVSDLDLERVLGGYSDLVLRVLQLIAPPQAAAHMERYISDVRPMPPLLTGDDLRLRGLPPGPRYRQVLHALREQQLAGAIRSRDAALRWLDQHI